jgi:hypothetical protein
MYDRGSIAISLCRTYPQGQATARTEISGPSLIIAPVTFPSLSLSVFARLQSCWTSTYA